jgi:hypothetical protein
MLEILWFNKVLFCWQSSVLNPHAAAELDRYLKILMTYFKRRR